MRFKIYQYSWMTYILKYGSFQEKMAHTIPLIAFPNRHTEWEIFRSMMERTKQRHRLVLREEGVVEDHD